MSSLGLPIALLQSIVIFLQFFTQVSSLTLTTYPYHLVLLPHIVSPVGCAWPLSSAQDFLCYVHGGCSQKFADFVEGAALFFLTHVIYHPLKEKCSHGTEYLYSNSGTVCTSVAIEHPTLVNHGTILNVVAIKHTTLVTMENNTLVTMEHYALL